MIDHHLALGSLKATKHWLFLIMSIFLFDSLSEVWPVRPVSIHDSLLH